MCCINTKMNVNPLNFHKINFTYGIQFIVSGCHTFIRINCCTTCIYFKEFFNAKDFTNFVEDFTQTQGVESCG